MESRYIIDVLIVIIIFIISFIFGGGCANSVYSREIEDLEKTIKEYKDEYLKNKIQIEKYKYILKKEGIEDDNKDK